MSLKTFISPKFIRVFQISNNPIQEAQNIDDNHLKTVTKYFEVAFELFKHKLIVFSDGTSALYYYNKYSQPHGMEIHHHLRQRM